MQLLWQNEKYYFLLFNSPDKTIEEYQNDIILKEFKNRFILMGNI